MENGPSALRSCAKNLLLCQINGNTTKEARKKRMNAKENGGIWESPTLVTAAIAPLNKEYANIDKKAFCFSFILIY